jgi:hypothetical protein
MEDSEPLHMVCESVDGPNYTEELPQDDCEFSGPGILIKEELKIEEEMQYEADEANAMFEANIQVSCSMFETYRYAGLSITCFSHRYTV